MKFRFQCLWIFKECMFQTLQNFCGWQEILATHNGYRFCRNFSTKWTMFQRNSCTSFRNTLYEEFIFHWNFLCKLDTWHCVYWRLNVISLWQFQRGFFSLILWQSIANFQTNEENQTHTWSTIDHLRCGKETCMDRFEANSTHLLTLQRRSPIQLRIVFVTNFFHQMVDVSTKSSLVYMSRIYFSSEFLLVNQMHVYCPLNVVSNSQIRSLQFRRFPYILTNQKSPSLTHATAER